ncbi:MAG: cob(I)yrinic acid a,c-diamide adenosyltransferase [Leptospiraceae bacterium]|nr:cob(I)yrinic acid a,c-diamide adenosyltransferase [Leptospiraceae bacterium]
MALKIYTKTGDKGETSLANGKRVSKADPQVELYGTVDELNSAIGIGVSFLTDEIQKEEIYQIQSLLFELGSELAGFRVNNTSVIYENDIEFLEKEIDKMQVEIPPLKSFILPGGTQAAAFFHLARTICRRLERLMVKNKQEGQEIFEVSIKFINRLSDYLFVLARFLNFKTGKEDIPWRSRAKG